MFASMRKALFLYLGILILLIVYFAPGAYRKAKMDEEVDRLCSTAGGIKVYERVLLPANKFNRWGDPDVQRASNFRAAGGHDYFLEDDLRALVKGNPSGKGDPTLHRFYYRVVRNSDRKVLGEAISFSRFGGDADHPFHPSSYVGCTEMWSLKKLFESVFEKEK